MSIIKHLSCALLPVAAIVRFFESLITFKSHPIRIAIDKIDEYVDTDVLIEIAPQEELNDLRIEVFITVPRNSTINFGLKEKAIFIPELIPALAEYKVYSSVNWKLMICSRQKLVLGVSSELVGNLQRIKNKDGLDGERYALVTCS